MGVNLSTNMNLPIPQVGNEDGPQYAQDVNDSFTLVDQHNHSAGYGVPVNPSGLDINSDLSMGGNNLFNARSLRLAPQSALLSGSDDIGCVYESGVDLYYNDGLGNQIRITQSGAVAGTPGSIANLTPPASASYSSGTSTFVWQSAANTPANMDAASYIFRNLVANSKGLTLSPPNAMAADYTITLPVLPASQKIMTLDAAGSMAAAYSVDNATIEVSSNIIQVKNQGITQAKLAPRATGTTVAAGGVAVSASSGSFLTTSNTPVAVTNLSVTITTLGRPVSIALASSGAINSYVGADSTVTETATGIYYVYRDGVEIYRYEVNSSASTAAGTTRIRVPSSSINVLDLVAAGTYLYEIFTARDSNTTSSSVFESKLIVYEI